MGAVAFAATGVGLGIEVAGIAGVALGESAVGAAEYLGSVALISTYAGAAIDGTQCIFHHDMSACAGAALGATGGAFGSVAKFGGEALVGAGNEGRVGWDLSGGLFGVGGVLVDGNSFLHACSGR